MMLVKGKWKQRLHCLSIDNLTIQKEMIEAMKKGNEKKKEQAAQSHTHTQKKKPTSKPDNKSSKLNY